MVTAPAARQKGASTRLPYVRTRRPKGHDRVDAPKHRVMPDT
ncbi:hypothetical protein OHA25_20655 [Nonomuraea sp. NBC_00507]